MYCYLWVSDYQLNILKYNNTAIITSKLIYKFCFQQTLCDVTVVCQGQYFSAHKVILSLNSIYFEKLFSKTPCKHPFIIIKDIEPRYFEYILHFIYQSEVVLPKNSIKTFLNAAEALNIKGLDETTKEPFNSASSKEKRSPSRSVSPAVSNASIPSRPESPLENATNSIKCAQILRQTQATASTSNVANLSYLTTASNSTKENIKFTSRNGKAKVYRRPVKLSPREKVLLRVRRKENSPEKRWERPSKLLAIEKLQQMMDDGIPHEQKTVKDNSKKTSSVISNSSNSKKAQENSGRGQISAQSPVRLYY